MKLVSGMVIYIIKFYQIGISPILGKNCRYNPTCSNYFIECLRKHPFRRALYLGIKRIFNCHPFSGSGYDPVP